MQIANLRKSAGQAFVCTYVVNGLSYGVTLHGETEEAVLKEYGDRYPNLRVDGVLQGYTF